MSEGYVPLEAAAVTPTLVTVQKPSYWLFVCGGAGEDIVPHSWGVSSGLVPLTRRMFSSLLYQAFANSLHPLTPVALRPIINEWLSWPETCHHA